MTTLLLFSALEKYICALAAIYVTYQKDGPKEHLTLIYYYILYLRKFDEIFSKEQCGTVCKNFNTHNRKMCHIKL